MGGHIDARESQRCRGVLTCALLGLPPAAAEDPVLVSSPNTPRRVRVSTPARVSTPTAGLTAASRAFSSCGGLHFIRVGRESGRWGGCTAGCSKLLQQPLGRCDYPATHTLTEPANDMAVKCKYDLQICPRQCTNLTVCREIQLVEAGGARGCQRISARKISRLWTPRPGTAVRRTLTGTRRIYAVTLSVILHPVSEQAMHALSRAALAATAARSAGTAHSLRSSLALSCWRSIFIQVEKTPNPDAMKFMPEGQTVLPEEHGNGLHFSELGQAKGSKLVRRLLKLDQVTGVFLGRDFISVNKREEANWAALKPVVLDAMMDAFSELESKGTPIIVDVAPALDTKITEDDDEVTAMIKELLETRIRPAVQEDGGDIFFM